MILRGDCLIELKKLDDNSVDSIVTDPPYELNFMGKGWDATGIAYNVDMWKECLRVLKPGGHLLSFGGTRTYHRMAVAIEDAGFEVRDMIEWVYGSGFPKSRNIGLDVDKRNGVTKNRGKAFVVAGQSGQRDKDTGGDLVPGSNTMGAYVAQNEFSGWGTALKPAHEPICMARKPLSEKTVAENCLKWGTGGINIDESRVEGEAWTRSTESMQDIRGNAYNSAGDKRTYRPPQEMPLGGRFPANLIHDNSEEVRECFPETKSTPHNHNHKKETTIYGGGKGLGIREGGSLFNDSGNASRFFKSIPFDDGRILYVEKWKYRTVRLFIDLIESGESEKDAMAMVGELISKGYLPSKPPSETQKSIAYYPKASKSERNKGCEGLEEKQYSHDGREKPIENAYQRNKSVATNNHPTVKPIALMEYLIKMVTPKGGIVLDPFMGSGSTGVAAKKNGFDFIGIEREAEYIKIAEARINAVDIPQEYAKLINKHFWELTAEADRGR